MRYETPRRLPFSDLTMIQGRPCFVKGLFSSRFREPFTSTRALGSGVFTMMSPRVCRRLGTEEPSGCCRVQLWLMRCPESSPPRQLPRFEISARVTVYRGMNYLLPTLLTAISDLSMDDQSEVIPAGEPAATGAEPSRSPRNSLDDADDTADRLEERLRSRLGSLPVSSETTPRPRPGQGIPPGRA